MERFSRKWDKPTLIKLIIAFIIITTVEYIFGISMYYQGNLALQKELTSSAMTQVKFFMDSLETEIARIKKQEYAFLFDDNLYKLSSVSEYIGDVEKLEAEFRLHQGLIAIKESSAYIHNAFVLFPSTGEKISSVPGVDKVLENEVNSLKGISGLSNAQIIFWDSRMFLSAAYPLLEANDNKTTPKYIIAAELSKNVLLKALRQFSDNNGSGAVLINSVSGYDLLTGAESGIKPFVLEFVKGKPKEQKSGTGRISFNGESYLGIYVTSDYLEMTLCKYVHEDEVFKPLKKYQFQFAVFLIAALFLIIIYYFSSYKFIQQPLNRLIKSFRKVEQGELDFKIEHKKEDEFGYLYQRFNNMVQHLKLLIDQAYKQKIFAQRAELKHLQSQINPHFLYNSYFNQDLCSCR